MHEMRVVFAQVHEQLQSGRDIFVDMMNQAEIALKVDIRDGKLDKAAVPVFFSTASLCNDMGGLLGCL